jgi:hypothetical protein
MATALATVALTALPLAAQAAHGETLDVRGYDAAPVTTPGSFQLDGAAWGSSFEGTGTLTVTALDGSLPARGACEDATVALDAGTAPTEYLSIRTTGEICAHPIDGTLTVNGYFGKKDVTYVGDLHKKAKAAGLVAARVGGFLNIWTASGTIRW